MPHPRAPKKSSPGTTKSARSYPQTGRGSSTPRPFRARLFAGGRSAGGYSRALSRTCHAAFASSLRTRRGASDPEPHHAVRAAGITRGSVDVSQVHHKYPCAVEHINTVCMGITVPASAQAAIESVEACTFTSETARRSQPRRRPDSCGVESRTRCSDRREGTCDSPVIAAEKTGA